MKKDPKVFLEHITYSINQIERYTKNISAKQFMDDVETQDAVMRRFEIIGEATKNLPEELKGKYPDIKWRQIAGLRDKLIHEYFGVDTNLVWKLVSRDLKLFKTEILKLIKELG